MKNTFIVSVGIAVGLVLCADSLFGFQTNFLWSSFLVGLTTLVAIPTVGRDVARRLFEPLATEA